MGQSAWLNTSTTPYRARTALSIFPDGPGFNLTGPEKRKVFLLLSLGYGFKF